MSNRTKFEKVTSKSPSRADMPKSDDSKFIPGNDESKDAHGYGCYYGDGHDFNIKGKSTVNGVNCYADMGKGSGACGNFGEKDSAMEYLQARNKKGQQVSSYTGTERHARLMSGGGATAYNAMPIPETYKPATSNGSVSPEAVEYKTIVKNRATK